MKDEKKGKGDAYPQTGFSASATSCEDGQGAPRGRSDRYSNCSDDSSTCVVQFKVFSLDGVSSLGSCPPFDARCSDLGCTQSFGSRKRIRRFQKYALYCGVTRGFCPCSKSFVFANSEGDPCRENCLVHFPTTPPCSATVDVLETGDVPILFSLLQIQIWVLHLNWIMA